MKAALVALSVFLLWSSVCTRLTAEARRRVVVLQIREPVETAWPAGSRAVVAELSARDDDLVLRAASSEPSELSQTLLAAANEPGTFAAVAMVRSEDRGIALVQLHGQKRAIRVEDDLSQGVIAEGSVALRVSELLHVRKFELPPNPPSPQAARGFEIGPWVAAGALGSSGAEAPTVALAFGTRISVTGPFELEASAALSLADLEVATRAGTADVSTQQLALHAYLNPFSEAPLGVALGLGGGVARLSETARAADGYVGHDAATLTGLASLRAVASLTRGPIRLFALGEASLLLPSVGIRASDGELATLGQPWLFAALGVGFMP
jgi:hypothetical protein